MISAIITTKNNEDTLAACLASLSFCSEIIVVDSGSSDQTLTIARQHTNKIYQNDWPGYGAQKNYGLAQASCDWVLFIDADEEVSPQLAQAITAATESGQYDFYWLKIITVFMDKKMNYLYGHNLRLFKKSQGQWNTSKVHEQVIDNSGTALKLKRSNSGLIEQPLFHHSHKTITSYLKKMHHYTSLEAQQMHKFNTHRSGQKIKPTFYLPIKLLLKQLIKMIFYRRGFLDGSIGLTWCFLSAYYEYESAQKYLRLVKNKEEK
jgi:glycosyltransferase involved in cell wall biosynthesis